jgi:Zn-finger nucleic acid-binding protein
VQLVMSERQGVEIDYCPQCRGVWLDRGELDKIVERSTKEQPVITPQAPSPYGSGYDRHEEKKVYGDHHGDYKHQKKRGFLHDLFD